MQKLYEIWWSPNKCKCVSHTNCVCQLGSYQAQLVQITGLWDVFTARSLRFTPLMKSLKQGFNFSTF